MTTPDLIARREAVHPTNRSAQFILRRLEQARERASQEREGETYDMARGNAAAWGSIEEKIDDAIEYLRANL